MPIFDFNPVKSTVTEFTAQKSAIKQTNMVDLH